MNEIWVPVKGYDGLYEVSNLGRVRSCDRLQKNLLTGSFSIRKGKLLSPCVRNKNKGVLYLFVRLFKDGKGKSITVHRLVAEAFVPNPEHKPSIDHIDTDIYNNSVENLRWVSEKENQNNPLTLKHVSERSPHKKRVGMFSKDGILLEVFESGTAAASEMRNRGHETNAHIILQICNKRPMKCRDGVYRQRKTTAGYVWKFI